MRVSIVVAMDEKNGIGKDHRVPWKLSKDLQNFKKITLGHPIIMGRKTYDSIGRPLPGRMTIIITRQPEYQPPLAAPENCLVIFSLDEALTVARKYNEEEAFIIGGGQIYAQALPLTDRIYLTRVRASFGCDVFFPEIDLSQWIEIESKDHPADVDNQVSFTYQVLDRIRS